MSNDTTVLDTVNIVDQNTGKQVAWQVEYAHPHNAPSARYPWTHQLVLRRPTGRVTYIVDAVLIGDVLVKHSTPRG
jgi:hypothetical protein